MKLNLATNLKAYQLTSFKSGGKWGYRPVITSIAIAKNEKKAFYKCIMKDRPEYFKDKKLLKLVIEKNLSKKTNKEYYRGKWHYSDRITNTLPHRCIPYKGVIPITSKFVI